MIVLVFTALPHLILCELIFFLGFSIHQVVTLQGMMGRMYAFICKQVCKEKDADATSWTIVPTYRIEVLAVFFQISIQEITGEPKFEEVSVR